MPLPSSGPLSLNDIAGEFGGSQPHSLSEYYAGGGLVPAGTSGTNGAVPSSGTISIFNFYGTSNIVYFIASANTGGSKFGNQPGSLSVAADGRAFAKTSDSAPQGTFAWTNSGLENWNRFYAGTGLGDATVLCDPNANVYVSGNGGSFAAGSLAKLNSSGTVQWVRTQNERSSPFSSNQSIDSSGNIYIGFSHGSPLFNQNCLVKIDTNANVQWYLGYAFSSSVLGNAVSPNGAHVWMAWIISAYNLVLLRLNSSGTPQMLTQLFDFNNNSGVLGQIAADDSGNVYLSAAADRTNVGPNFAKYNSSGAREWAFRVTSAYTSVIQSIALDSSGNVYATYNQTNNLTIVLKFNNSGTLQWARSFTNPSGLAYAVRTDSSGNVFLGGNRSNAVIIARFPPDGSKTGTYTVGGNSYTWATASPTLQSVTFSQSTPSPEKIDPDSFPWASNSVSPTSSSFTVSRTVI